VICTKVEYDQAERICNTTDSRCVKAFQAFRETYDLVRIEGSKRAAEVFVRFYLDMARWLISKSAPEIREMIFREHTSLFEFMRSEGFLKFVESDIRRWEFWDMPIINENTEDNQVFCPREFTVTDCSIVLTEMSRLKHFVLELRGDNAEIRAESVSMRTEIRVIEKENAALKAENETLKAENEALKAENEATKAEIVILQDDNKALQAYNSRLLRISSRKIVRIAIFIVDCLSLKIFRRWGHHESSHN
jgi:cell division protein FtsB